MPLLPFFVLFVLFVDFVVYPPLRLAKYWKTFLKLLRLRPGTMG